MSDLTDPQRRTVLVAGAVAAASLRAASPAPAHATTPRTDGFHGFDFEVGSWTVHHRIKRPTGEVVEFDGTCVNRPLMGGQANVEEHTFHRPAGVSYGVAMRAYDAKTGLWAIWWVDSRDPHLPLDPPVKGRFEDGVGTFYADSLMDGKMTRTRFIWSRITASSAQWEQAFSTDSGASWDTNWVMAFSRTS
jgi:hypothetical protein